MVRQIYINENPLQMFTDKEGEDFKQLVNELLLLDKDFKEHFNQLYDLRVGLTNTLEVYVWGDEDSKTITLELLTLL